MKFIDPQASPGQIEVVVKLPDKWASLSDKLKPQLDQLPALESLKGIYRFESIKDETQKLVWCFSNEGDDPPDDFEVSPGSNRTLVKLERFDPGVANSIWAKSIVSGGLLSMLD